MTITNGYATLAEYHSYVSARGQTAGAGALDDLVIENLIEAASRYFDRQCGRTFYPRAAQTRVFDVPEGRELALDDDLTSITTITNGDGSVITSAQYVLLPANTTPKRSIKLRASASVTWTFTAAGDTEQAISVLGSWGYAQSAPDDVKEAVLAIAQGIYSMRSGQASSGKVTITAAGMVIRPEEVPPMAQKTIESYRRKI